MIGTVTILLAIIVVYQQVTKFTDKATSTPFGIVALRVIAEVYVSVLYIPSIYIYLLFFSCRENASGSLVNTYIKGEICYSGSNIIYNVIGGALAVFITVFTFLMSQLLFECRLSSQEISLRLSTQGDLLMFIYKIVLVVSTIVLVSAEHQTILIAIIILCGLVVFSYTVTNQIFMDMAWGKIQTIFVSCNTWVAICLTLAKLTERQDFSDCLQIYLIGVLLLVFINLLKVENRYDLLVNNINSSINEQAAYNSIYMLVRLLLQFSSNSEFQYVLEGYLEIHRVLCVSPDCPSKLRVQKTNQYVKQMRADKLPETYINLLWTIRTQFTKFLIKYPNSTRLRLFFSLYLLDVVKTKQHALSEIDNLLLENPTFSEEFQCFRYRSVIEREIISSTTNKKSDNSASNANSDINELSLHGFLLKCEQNLIRSANLFSELWSQVLENQPDLTKICKIGFQIQEIVQSIQQEQKTNLEMEHLVPSIVRQYAVYQREIIYDSHESDKILQQLAKYLDENRHGTTTKTMHQITDISQEPLATVTVSGGKRRLLAR